VNHERKRYTIPDLLWQSGRWSDLSPWNRRKPTGNHYPKSACDDVVEYGGSLSTTALMEYTSALAPGTVVYYGNPNEIANVSPDELVYLSQRGTQAMTPLSAYSSVHRRSTCTDSTLGRKKDT